MVWSLINILHLSLSKKHWILADTVSKTISFLCYYTVSIEIILIKIQYYRKIYKDTTAGFSSIDKVTTVKYLNHGQIIEQETIIYYYQQVVTWL